MSEQTIDYETGEIVPVEQPIIFIPSPQDALDAWNAYQELCKKLLNDSDYATIRGKKARKRTGWAKLRRALNISTEIVYAEWEEFDEGDCGYIVTVRAAFPDGRHEDGDGYCDSYELHSGNIAPTRHNIRAKAVTRAKNRATADLIGSGEVSAEEFVDDDIPARTRQQNPPARSRSGGNGQKPRANEGDVPTSPTALLAEVDNEIDGSYGNLPDLKLAIQSQLGEGWSWPAANDVDGWAEAKEAAIKHAEAA